jgi:hypothetical protein
MPMNPEHRFGTAGKQYMGHPFDSRGRAGEHTERTAGEAILDRCRIPDGLIRRRVVKVGKKRGRKIRLSLARRMVGDFLAVSQRVPLAHGERRIDIRALQEAVMALPRPRPDWLPLFFKAYAIVAAERPALRRLFVRRPWPYLYEHPENVGSVVIARRLDGDDALLYLPIIAPEKLPLGEISRILKEAREKPLADIPAFRRQLRLGRLPGLCRRPLLQLGIDWTTRHRARVLGTFGVSVLANMGLANLITRVPWTTMIHYTPFDDGGSMLLRIAIDHRVLDGMEVAYALRETEEVLNRQILGEVLQMGPAETA